MSDAVVDFNLDDEDVPTGFRDWGKEAKKTLKEQAKLIAELKAKDSERTVSSLLAEAKVPDWARELYHGEPTKESVEAWTSKYAEKFGIETGQQQPPPEAAAAAQVQGLLSQAPAAQTKSIADQLALMENGSEADIAAAFPGFFAQY